MPPKAPDSLCFCTLWPSLPNLHHMIMICTKEGLGRRGQDRRWKTRCDSRNVSCPWLDVSCQVLRNFSFMSLQGRLRPFKSDVVKDDFLVTMRLPRGCSAERAGYHSWEPPPPVRHGVRRRRKQVVEKLMSRTASRAGACGRRRQG